MYCQLFLIWWLVSLRLSNVVDKIMKLEYRMHLVFLVSIPQGLRWKRCYYKCLNAYGNIKHPLNWIQNILTSFMSRYTMSLLSENYHRHRQARIIFEWCLLNMIYIYISRRFFYTLKKSVIFCILYFYIFKFPRA